MNIRERFEEIWPVPEGVIWCRSTGLYWYLRHELESPLEFKEWNDRLDTFTRCQETTDVYVSLISELVKEVEDAYSAYGVTPECVDRAKQIMGSKQ